MVQFKGQQISRRRFIQLLTSSALSVGAASVMGASMLRSDTPTGFASSDDPCAKSGDSGGSELGDIQMPSGEPKDFEGEVKRNDTVKAVKKEFHFKNLAIINDTPTKGHGGGRAFYPAVTDPNGVGIIENCYMEGAKQNNGIFVHPKHHRGTLIFRNNYVTRWGGDALYAETAKPHGQGGAIIVSNCYFKDNNISHVRISNGKVMNTVIHNTGNVPSNFKDLVNSRGLDNMYAGSATVTVENCHIDVGSHNTNGAASAVHIVSEGSHWNIKNSQLKGPRGDSGNATYTNVGENPNIHIPDGVPGRPE